MFTDINVPFLVFSCNVGVSNSSFALFSHKKFRPMMMSSVSCCITSAATVNSSWCGGNDNVIVVSPHVFNDFPFAPDAMMFDFWVINPTCLANASEMAVISAPLSISALVCTAPEITVTLSIGIPWII